ncbi:HET-domain-containing protein [Venturia nashicola]|uniref:HET-domain-containing protein n=1 Tax=Venturia nashicola TaxID=86259 RepID=A0A4Z1P602_9PEZI|nr:HET-domain-containing protein [Venturia nashicola]
MFQTIRVRSSKDELQDPNSSVYGTEDPPRARFIDPGGIRRWLKACEMHHGTHCSSQANGLDTTFRGPSWLIDTQNDCLVSGNSGRFYFALSYCWGSSVSTSLTEGNLGVLQERNALKKVSMVLPATIKDTMRLVLQLKGRYLWVDKLYIPQDDNVVKKKKKKKLASMAMIYANAHVTVVTAQGMDANDGLHGMQGAPAREDESPSPFGSVENMWTDSIFELDMPDQNISDAEQMEEQSQLLLATTWSSRGWTFQE